MNEKGFTLIELIAIIALLSIIFLVAYNSIDKALTTSEEELFEVQKANIKEAAKNWVTDNVDKLPETNNASCIVTLATLQSGNYIETSIKNSKNKETLTDVYVVITKHSANYIFEVSEGTANDTCV